ncbi:hypothetical protein [Bradyrhizobium sp. USDA 4504]
MSSTARRRAPEHVASTVRKVEPLSGGLVRLYFAVEREGAWDDQCTLLMPCSSIGDALGFAVQAAREIARETGGAVQQIEHRGGTVN